ncbi:hypothetical protein JHK87_044295 [Glycine soja]|nr:hypothetical protein JHK87_044295 [Glycine soja]
MQEGEETDDFYEFTAKDYYRLLATKKEDTTLPKKVINDMSRDFYAAGFCPGAIVYYFSYNVP